MKNRIAFTRILALATLAVCASLPAILHAQASRLVGTVTAISGNTLTVKPDAGEQQQVTVPDSATLKRLAPGEKDLSAAPAIQLADVAVGDRVLIKLDASASSPTASLLVAMKQTDVAQIHQKDSDAWQRGVSGLVKKVDPASGEITIASGAGPTGKSITVKTTGSTKLMRYAPTSVRFADARPAALDAIKPGDQLRARGTKNPDGTEMAADEVISGTFLSIAGTIASVDADSSTLVVKDLASKKLVTIHTGPDAQLRQLPEHMAQMLSARLKGGGGAAAAIPGGGPPSNGAPAGGGAKSGGGNPAPPNGGGTAGPNGSGRWGGQGQMGGDPQRMLSAAPAVKLSDLQKGQAVMVVATDGSSNLNAITLLSGVEPLLEAPAATNLLSNWSVGGGGGGEGAAGPQ
jgi:Cu/Ag efflux protein CusF